MLSLERRRRILELAAQHQVLVVEDDPYGDLYFGEPPPPSLLALSDQIPGSRDYLAYCGSLSKVLSPGLRVGWLGDLGGHLAVEDGILQVCQEALQAMQGAGAEVEALAPGFDPQALWDCWRVWRGALVGPTVSMALVITCERGSATGSARVQWVPSDPNQAEPWMPSARVLELEVNLPDQRTLSLRPNTEPPATPPNP
jgi:hypothetical protein